MTTRREELVRVLRSIDTTQANEIADAAESFKQNGGSGAGSFLNTLQVTVPQTNNNAEVKALLTQALSKLN
jgi:hypothetical protein